MSYAIIRNDKLTRVDAQGSYIHNDRRSKGHSNKDIDPTRTHLNFWCKKNELTYIREFDKMKKEYDLKGTIRSNSNIMCEMMITSDNAFFNKIGLEETKRYFKLAYDFVVNYNNLGEEFIVSAKVHNDETTPHLHIVFIPVVHTTNKKGKEINKIACSEFWKGKESYRILQDRFYKYVTDNGFDLERGNTKDNEHIPIEKLKKITNFEVQEMFKDTNCLEQEKITDNIEVMRNDYKRVINKFNTLAKRYTRIKNIVEETMYKTEQVQEENYVLKQENKELKKEVLTLRDYIDKTFEYVSLLFDFSKDRLKRLVNSFIYSLNKEK